MGDELHLVLAENDETASGHSWCDVTGERYQFPNVYRNMIVPGVRFVYYRGSRRTAGRRASPEYFGRGVVGDVYLDPETSGAPSAGRRWIAEIADYQRFHAPVPFRSNGLYSELLSDVAPRNRWGTGVRRISLKAYEFLVTAGGLPISLYEAQAAATCVAEECPVSEIWRCSLPSTTHPTAQTRYGFDYSELSERTRIIAGEARRIFLEHLRASEPNKAKWSQILVVRDKSKSLAYDVEDCRDARPTAYLIKGTTGPQFASIDMTPNQIQCAVSLRERFGLVLVSGVFSAAPRVAVVRNVAETFETKRLIANATRFRVHMAS
jgi:hypothetical protein